MAVVRNLMIRIGADYSAARQAMQGASRELTKFKNETTRATKGITGTKGLGGISAEFKTLKDSVTSSLSQIRGAKGIGGVTSALGTLRPMLSSATRGLSTLGTAAGGVGAAFGGAAIGIGAFVSALALATFGIYKASQEAVKFEADIGRLNISLREGARGYMEWARSQGLAKQSAVELGATYANLLGSFISDTKELQQSTQDLVHATRVIASYTGRSLDDVFNRIRSGMLGSTEAIEDLGVYVNISMIESTEAFRKFAGDKSWNQLTFQQQQQIRLAAILEQTYKRYGNQIQQNVMAKQERLMEQLKDIKLHLSQAFLPIWDTILPALTRLAEALARATEELARFIYWLRGWNYDEMTKGSDKATDSIIDQGDAYDDLADSVKKAKNELASFDRLNLIGFPSSEGTGGGGGTGTGGGFAPPSGIPGSRINWPDLPEIPPALTRKYRIEFDPPHPPDAGMGAVATAVTSTVDQMAAETRNKMNTMWGELGAINQIGTLGLAATWDAMLKAIQQQLINARSVIQSEWHGTLDFMQSKLNAYRPYLEWGYHLIGEAIRARIPNLAELKTSWHEALDFMQSKLNAYRPYLEWGLHLIGEAIRGRLPNLAELKAGWHDALDYMQSKLNAYRPYIEWGLHLIGEAVRAILPDLSSLKSAWANTLSDMLARANEKLGGIISTINAVISAWQSMMSMLGAKTNQPATQPETTPQPSTSPTIWDTAKGWASNVFSPGALGAVWEGIQKEAQKPENKVVTGVVAGSWGVQGIGQIAPKVGAKLNELWQAIGEWISGLAPAFASGGIVYGPTLAMVGEYAGAASNPEVIAPLSDLENMFDNSEQTAILREILRAIRAGQNVTVTISESEVGRAAANYHNREVRRTGQSPFYL